MYVSCCMCMLYVCNCAVLKYCSQISRLCDLCVSHARIASSEISPFSLLQKDPRTKFSRRKRIQKFFSFSSYSPSSKSSSLNSSLPRRLLHTPNTLLTPCTFFLCLSISSSFVLLFFKLRSSSVDISLLFYLLQSFFHLLSLPYTLHRFYTLIFLALFTLKKTFFLMVF